MNLDQILSQFGLSPAMVQDMTLLLVVLVTSFILGMFIGRSRMISVLINIYVSMAVLSVIPMELLPDYNYRLIFFLASITALTLISKKLFDLQISGAGSGFLIRVFALSFLEIVLIISTVLTIIPKNEALAYVSGSSYEYLASPNFHLVWTLIPLLFMYVIHKKIIK